jgi:nucleoside-diphosphate-sugar epimerase
VTATSVLARVLVTGNAGHLGEALVRVPRDGGYDVTRVDSRQSPHTTVVGSVADRALRRDCVAGADLRSPMAVTDGSHRQSSR